MNAEHYATYSDPLKPVEERYAAALALAEEATDPQSALIWKSAATGLQSLMVDANGRTGDEGGLPASQFDLTGMNQQQRMGLLNERLRQSNLTPLQDSDPDVQDREPYTEPMTWRPEGSALEQRSEDDVSVDWHSELNRKASEMFNQLHGEG